MINPLPTHQVSHRKKISPQYNSNDFEFNRARIQSALAGRNGFFFFLAFGFGFFFSVWNGFALGNRDHCVHQTWINLNHQMAEDTIVKLAGSVELADGVR
jgi:hypothetical protein